MYFSVTNPEERTLLSLGDVEDLLSVRVSKNATTHRWSWGQVGKSEEEESLLAHLRCTVRNLFPWFPSPERIRRTFPGVSRLRASALIVRVYQPRVAATADCRALPIQPTILTTTLRRLCNHPPAPPAPPPLSPRRRRRIGCMRR